MIVKSKGGSQKRKEEEKVGGEGESGCGRESIINN